MAGLKHPVTPDGRYFVVRGKLWRRTNPGLSTAVRSELVRELMAARSAVRSSKLLKNLTAEAAAHHAVDLVKRKLGGRGPVWWTDGSPDLNRQTVKNTPYASWFSGLRVVGERGPPMEAPRFSFEIAPGSKPTTLPGLRRRFLIPACCNTMRLPQLPDANGSQSGP
jgi:hypothetical protein